MQDNNEVSIEQPTIEEPDTEEMIVENDGFEIFQPTLTYPGAYNGPLYATSEQIGDDYPIGKYMANLDKNGVNWFIGFFTFSEPQENFLNNLLLFFLRNFNNLLL